MKNNLDILIEHLQLEFDALKSSMDACVEDWDFDGAKAFRGPLIFTRRKLNVLKNLKNPHFNKISQLSGMITSMQRILNDPKYERSHFDEDTRLRMQKYFKESTEKRIEKSKIELKHLQSILPEQRHDDDKVFYLLEKLEQGEIREIEFEIKKDTIFLVLRVDDQKGEFKLRAANNRKLEHFLIAPTKSILRKLGFNTETFKRELTNYKAMDKNKILEEMAILYFEVFGVFGKEVNYRIIKDPTDNTV